MGPFTRSRLEEPGAHNCFDQFWGGEAMNKLIRVESGECWKLVESSHMLNLLGHMCHGQKSRFVGDGHHTFNRNPYNRYINPYYWVDDHPLLYGNNGSLDPGTHSPKYPDPSNWLF